MLPTLSALHTEPVALDTLNPHMWPRTQTCLPSAPQNRQSDTGLADGPCQRGPGPLLRVPHSGRRARGRTAAKGPGGRVSRTRKAHAHAGGSPWELPEPGRRDHSHGRAVSSALGAVGRDSGRLLEREAEGTAHQVRVDEP